jgi:uncharacterized protein
VKYVLVYESADDVAQTAPVHFAAHRARWPEFQANGTLLLIGPYSDQSGALAVFTTREAAEEFARSDPFVLNGVVRDWWVKEWMEALGGP